MAGSPADSVEQEFGSATNAITMTTKKGAVRAKPGTLGSGGAFADTWYHR
ncbi:MAG TPA: hypothetical protein VG321_09370 [Solirubrobacteraceae bacterium]|nr:hypothetical protein [Solirubrobacteraceae bacterium]